jgi:dTDP-L-rhamnose 4-epimerase
VPKTVLITGGAGFIGSHLADELLRCGYRVRVLDSLQEQVHGDGDRPSYLASDVELVRGDVRDAAAVTEALDAADAVFHFAARVGVGQSMYELAAYTGANSFGTAVLLERLLDRPVERLVVASSMSVYGEGLYRDASGRLHEDVERTRDQLARGEWDPCGPDGQELEPVPTPETKRPALTSVYALNKLDQERLCLIFGSAYEVPTVALRFFNVYGPRQALSNPYTGVLAIFAARLLNGRRPLVFEDGRQRRDLVAVHDVVCACRLALERDEAVGHVVNIGSGRSVSVAELAQKLARVLDCEALPPDLTGKARAGDIRHCFADISLAREVLAYEPRVGLERGIAELAEWLEGQAADDRVDAAAAELQTRGLTL